MKLLLVGILLSVSSVIQAQDVLGFSLLFDGAPLKKGEIKEGTSISKCVFYIGRIEVYSAGEMTVANEAYHLMDPVNGKSEIPLVKPEGQVDSLVIIFGVDSLTNVSGVFGGDLDPTTGMYWAWNSGFVNFKLEGQSENLKTPKKKFTYHLGGYLPPYQTMRRVSSECSNESNPILELDISELLKRFQLDVDPVEMSPGAHASELMDLFVKQFRLK